MAPPSDPQKLKDVLTWLGVTNQLFITRANHYLSALDLPLPQFSVLNHFTRRVEETGTTVTGLANAFQANQPAMTKTVQQLVAKGFLDARQAAEDRRVKRLHLTEAGRAAHEQAILRLAPDVGMIFADWSSQDIDALHRLLFRLKSWLDEHRETRPDTGQNTSGEGGDPSAL